ncbi:metallophosphoesterase family protein [Crossiella sp. CA198]|uniref:metallophosphoesterase family protein n=1 Tax=Crossiella sp. CA198 TaxID=3455607 RepID=UPI003F8CFC4E
MKILHTSDWHVGRTTYGQSRSVDHDSVLQEIITLARSERPDLIVHSGDLFDHARPSIEDMGKVVTVLKEVAAIAPVVVVRGNHDSAAMFQFFSHAFGIDHGIHFVDEPRNPDAGGVLRFPCGDGTGLRLAVLPFVHANRVVDAFDDVNHWRAAYAERIGRMEQELAAELLRGFDPRRDIAMFAAHQYVSGAHINGSERSAHVADFYATNPKHVPAVGYAAFGHIHKPQRLPSTRVPGRYAGSPIQLDFGEAGEQKSVVLVDLRPGQQADIELAELGGGRPLRRLDGTLDELRALAPAVGRELCLVTVHTPTHLPNLTEQVLGLLPDAVVLDVKGICADQKLEVLNKQSVSADAEPDLNEYFRDFLADQGSNTVAADRLMAAFTTVLTRIEEEQQTPLPEESLLTQPLESPCGH